MCTSTFGDLDLIFKVTLGCLVFLPGTSCGRHFSITNGWNIIKLGLGGNLGGLLVHINFWEPSPTFQGRTGAFGVLDHVILCASYSS